MDAFNYQIPYDYAEKLKNWLGPPTLTGLHVVGWEDVYEPYVLIKVQDEYISHDFPKQHYDFVYSYARIHVTPEQACELAKVTGSILIDQLKEEVGARCGDLLANDVTLSFVEDVVEGIVEPTKEQYAKRINKGLVTREKYNAHKLLALSIGEEEEKSGNCLLM